MSKTPCEELGYKVGDKFKVVEGNIYFPNGSIVTLIEDDGDDVPLLSDGAEESYLCLERIEKIHPESAKKNPEFGDWGTNKLTGERVRFILKYSSGEIHVWADNPKRTGIFNRADIHFDFEPKEGPEFIYWSDASDDMKNDVARIYYGEYPIKWIGIPQGRLDGNNTICITDYAGKVCLVYPYELKVKV